MRKYCATKGLNFDNVSTNEFLKLSEAGIPFLEASGFFHCKLDVGPCFSTKVYARSEQPPAKFGVWQELAAISAADCAQDCRVYVVMACDGRAIAGSLYHTLSCGQKAFNGI